MTEISYSDLQAQETLRDPQTFYGQLREHDPLQVFSFGALKIWLIAATYDEIAELLKDPRLVKDVRKASPDGATQQAIQQLEEKYAGMLQLLTQNMLGAD